MYRTNLLKTGIVLPVLMAFMLPILQSSAQDTAAGEHKKMPEKAHMMEPADGEMKHEPEKMQHTPGMAGKKGGMPGQMMGGHGGAMAKFNKVKFEPSTVCAECHESIVEEWSKSMHSRSRSAWYFSHKVASERMGMTCNNERSEAIPCQTCHEPGGVYPFGAVIQKKPAAVAATEGVTCDICHRINEIKGTGEFSYGPIDVKFGPYKDATSPYHKTVYSPLIEKSDFCVACHGQLSNLNGLTVCDTTRSWKESKYAVEGEDQKTCQSCHMPSFAGAAATGEGAPADAPKDRTRHSHLFLGPNSDPAMLMTAASVNQFVKKETDGSLSIKVEVINSGTGHDLPSGLPERLITLTVTGMDGDGNTVWQNWKENIYTEDRMAAFGLFGFNPMGGEVPPMGASRIDNLSLLPDEIRILNYTLSKEMASKVQSVEAKLTYYAARPEGIFYFGNFGLPGVAPRPMASVVTPVK
jgi:hypothetical protein